MSRVVIHLQFGGWPRAALPASPAPLVQFVAEVRLLGGLKKGWGMMDMGGGGD